MAFVLNAALRDHLQVLNFYILRGVPVDDASTILCMVFHLLDSSGIRDYSNDGYRKLRISWSSFYSRFLVVSNDESMRVWRSDFLQLISECFPLTEEVT